jgi:hypothetical protein
LMGDISMTNTVSVGRVAPFIGSSGAGRGTFWREV